MSPRRILFNTTASGRIPGEHCGNSAPGGIETCRYPGSSDSVELNMTTLSWKTTLGPMDRGPLLPWV